MLEGAAVRSGTFRSVYAGPVALRLPENSGNMVGVG